MLRDHDMAGWSARMTGRCTEFLVRVFAAGMPGRFAAPPATAHLAASTPSILTLHKQA